MPTDPDLFSSLDPDAPKTCGTCGERTLSMFRTGKYCALSFRDVEDDRPACGMHQTRKEAI